MTSFWEREKERTKFWISDIIPDPQPSPEDEQFIEDALFADEDEGQIFTFADVEPGDEGGEHAVAVVDVNPFPRSVVPVIPSRIEREGEGWEGMLEWEENDWWREVWAGADWEER